jgi:hypothetical protein
MIYRNTVRAACLLIAGAFLFTASAFADGGEIAVFGGGAVMSDTGAGTLTGPVFGASAGYGVAGQSHVFAEFSMVHQSTSVLGYSTTMNTYDFGGGLDCGFGSSKKAVPYGVFAAGMGRTAASTSSLGVSVSGNSLYVAAGGGARIYLGDRWGVKPECRYQRYVEGTVPGTNEIVFTLGLFYGGRK